MDRTQRRNEANLSSADDRRNRIRAGKNEANLPIGSESKCCKHRGCSRGRAQRHSNGAAVWSIFEQDSRMERTQFAASRQAATISTERTQFQGNPDPLNPEDRPELEQTLQTRQTHYPLSRFVSGGTPVVISVYRAAPQILGIENLK